LCVDRSGISRPSAINSQPARQSVVARQPVFDRDQKVFGYELLFREGLENFFSTNDVEAACRHTLASSFLMGLDHLCGGARILINCTRDALLRGYLTLLPPQLTIMEVLETDFPDREVRQACTQLKFRQTGTVQKTSQDCACADWGPRVTSRCS
jgi:c-di-GMP-related signal transduction protein